MMVNMRFTGIAFILMLWCSLGAGSDLGCLKPLGTCYAGEPQDAAIAGRYAYVEVYRGINVYDISDTAHPRTVAQIPINGEPVPLADDLLLVLNGGLDIVDLSDVQRPEIIGSFQATRDVYDAVVDGNLVYFAEVRAGGGSEYGYLEIVDISDLSSPVQLSFTTWRDARATDIGLVHHMGKTYLYLKDFDNKDIRIIDATNPEQPVEVGRWGSYGDIVVSGSIAYLLEEEKKLLVFDLGNPLKPNRISSVNTGADLGYTLRIDGRYAVVGGVNMTLGGDFQISTLSLIDIESPHNPELIRMEEKCQVYYGESGTQVAVSQEHELVIMSTACGITWMQAPSLKVFDEEVTFSNPEELAVCGSLAYTAERRLSKRLNIFDVSDPFNPIVTGTWSGDSNYDTTDVACSEDRAYLLNWEGDLRILDTSDPTDPIEVARLPVSGRDVQVLGSYLLVKTELYLLVLDAADPANLVEMARLEAPGHSLEVNPGHVLLWSSDEISVIDIDNPSQPVLAGSIDDLGTISDLTLFGDLICALTPEGLNVIDISDPTIPKKVGFYEVVDMDSVYASDNLVYMGRRHHEIIGLDLSDPAHPVEAVYIPHYLPALHFDGARLYSSDWHNLDILDISECEGLAPRADLDLLLDTAVANQPVHFHDTSTGSPTSWLWSFGDGNVSGEQNPVHTYTMGGPTQVTLTIGNHLGSDTITRTIDIILPRSTNGRRVRRHH
jgi:hypothetical protein